MTASTLLASLETAIAAFLANGALQSYTITTPDGGTQTVQRSSLTELMVQRDRLRAEADSATRGPARSYGRRGAL